LYSTQKWNASISVYQIIKPKQQNR